MWSSIVLFVLTFAVLGLLLGFASVYNNANNNLEKQNPTIAVQNSSTVSNSTQTTSTSNNNSSATR